MDFWANRRAIRYEVLPLHRDQSIESAIPAPEVTKTALRLRYLIEQCVPCELEEQQITRPHSRIITPKVIKAAKIDTCEVDDLTLKIKYSERLGEAVVCGWHEYACVGGAG